MENKITSKVALEKIDTEIKFLKQKKQIIKWINRMYKQHKILINKPIHLLFYDNDEIHQPIMNNLPENTKTITFLYYSKNYPLKLDNLPITVEKVLILQTDTDLDDIEKNIRIPFGCEVKILNDYNNNLYHTEKNDDGGLKIENINEDKKLYYYYTDVLNIKPETKLFTIRKVLGKQTIINIDIDKNKNGKKLLQTTSIDYCDYYKFYYDYKNQFDDIEF